MGKKYIIEIEDEPFGRNDDPNIPHGMDELWRVAGFKSLVFDAEGLRRLEPYESQSAYQKGYEAGFAEGRKQAEEHDGCDGCYYDPCGKDEEPCRSCRHRYESQYRRADDKIRVGDEVETLLSHEHGNAVVIGFSRIGVCYMYAGGVTDWDYESKLRKTGRHFSEVTKIMEALWK